MQRMIAVLIMLIAAQVGSICFAQTVNISGAIYDSATAVGVPNAIVSLVGNPAIVDTTDALGNFALVGATGTIGSFTTASSENLYILQNGVLTLSFSQAIDVTQVDVFNAAGARLYHAQRAVAAGTSETFARLPQTPGVSYVTIKTPFGIRTLTCFNAENRQTGKLSGRMESASLTKRLAGPYTVQIVEPGYATKQVDVSDASTMMGIVQLKPVVPELPVVPMALISRNVPAYMSGNVTNAQTANANDNNQSSIWNSNGTPKWLAYDLSAIPVEKRKLVMLTWYDPWLLDFNPCLPNPCGIAGMPGDYTIEINFTVGGGAAPANGWVSLLSITGNRLSSRSHEINMAGANWIRINFTSSPDNNIMIDMDIYDVSNGVTDAWLLMGDSITFMSMGRLGNDIQNRASTTLHSSWPVIVNAAAGGTRSSEGLTYIGSNLRNFPGKFIALCYGTNDSPDDVEGFFSRMDTLAIRILAAGRIPVIPTVPWNNGSANDIARMKTKRDKVIELYAKHPQIMHGPDLWALYEAHPNLIGSSDVHPTGAGSDSLRTWWAATMNTVY